MRLENSLATVQDYDRYYEAIESPTGPIMGGQYQVWQQPPMVFKPGETDQPAGGIGQKFDGLEYAVAELPNTDKESRGIFERKPPEYIRKDSVFSRLANYDGGDMPPVNATLLNNPAVETFETLQWGNPLTANYGDTVAQLSGQDDPRFLTQGAGVREVEDTQLDTSADDGHAIPGVASALDFFTNSTVRKETYVFVIGAIILAIGIFALTR